jgi:hypothetical protein
VTNFSGKQAMKSVTAPAQMAKIFVLALSQGERGFDLVLKQLIDLQ